MELVSKPLPADMEYESIGTEAKKSALKASEQDKIAHMHSSGNLLNVATSGDLESPRGEEAAAQEADDQ